MKGEQLAMRCWEWFGEVYRVWGLGLLGVASRVLNSEFGQIVDLGGLPNGVCVTRLPEQPDVRRTQAWE